MDVHFKLYNLEQNVNSILDNCNKESSSLWNKPLHHYYPDMEEASLNLSSPDEQKIYLKQYFGNFMKEKGAFLASRLSDYAEYWENCKQKIVDTFVDAFEIPVDDLFNDMECYVTLNNITEMFPERNAFEVFYLNTDRWVLSKVIREMIRLLWFHVWHNKFKEDPEEYEKPSLKWLFCELATSCILKDKRLLSLSLDHGELGKVYADINSLKIEGRPLLDLLYSMYNELPIVSFMEKGYFILYRNEKKIRKHLEKFDIEF